MTLETGAGVGAALTPRDYAEYFFDRLSAASVGLESGFSVITTEKKEDLGSAGHGRPSRGLGSRGRENLRVGSDRRCDRGDASQARRPVVPHPGGLAFGLLGRSPNGRWSALSR